MGIHNVADAMMAGQVLAQDKKWAAHALFVLMASLSLDTENEYGQAPRQVFVPQDRLAEMLWGEATPTRQDQVKDNVKTLRAAGLLRVLRRGGNGRTTRYELLFDPVDIVMEAAKYAAEIAVKKPRTTAASAKAKATRAAKAAAEAADEAALAEVAAVVDMALLPEVGGGLTTPNSNLPPEVGGGSGTTSAGGSGTTSAGGSTPKLQVPEPPALRGGGKKRIRRVEEENGSPEVSESPAAVDTMADNDDENGDGDVRSHWHQVAKQEAERAASRARGVV